MTDPLYGLHLEKDDVPPAFAQTAGYDRDALRRAVERIRNTVEIRACGVTEPHVVHPSRWHPGADVVCESCGAPFTVPAASRG